MTRWEERGWQEDDLNKLELSFLDRIFDMKEPQGVDATMLFAIYMNMVGVNPDNYPLFLKIIEMKNHWVVDALVGDNDLEQFFKLVQPNYFILKECFQSITNTKSGGMYEKSLIIFLSIIDMTFKNPIEGYRIYEITNEDLNNLGKHLDETQDQAFPLNMKILSILDKVASLIDPGQVEIDPKITVVAIHANNIRGKFLDMTKSLNEAIPDNLLLKGNFSENEIAPSKA
ncbi:MULTISPECIES: hypothetical protein [unclassified Oceanispirochaeta]|uniref:hypothetical protein n=1 Tax=unclassified Oceanispirochaeta TaxID=2635722 RepID=UPI000E09A3EF|nr:MULTISPECIES: hypothetical protein [unclassified Oceanispirochaeta]MBF9019060.1 hypothetical protein [Oceanispirochaeta sp. M2]NPD75561.1 hypothetical protein [Oceanispirochaeta sp. M1]RDG28581.1 hypothetical protein DV872_26100 [Oceanispirochaeta sp. M1]